MFPNDEVVAYGRANGLGSDYNDIMTAFLRDYYSSNLSLTDLWGRAWAEGYRSINGFTDFPGIANSEFYAPLTSSLILTRGTGNPTYSRATNSWEFDNEGKLITVPSGSARFGGARMVRNLIRYSEDLSNASWIKSNTCTITGTNLVNFPASNDRVDQYTYTFIDNTVKAICSSFVISGSGNISVELATVGGTYESKSQIFTLTDTPTRYELYFDFANPGHTQIGITFARRSATTATSATITQVQIENVTGQADQTASEYVSVGVLSAPYHGAGVDGVKWFDTHKSLSTISESSLLGNHAEGARTNSLMDSRDLTNAAWAATNITPAKTATGIDKAANSASTLTASAADATILQTLSLAAAARSFSAYVKRRTGTGSVYITRDGGTNWTDITSSLGASWTRVKIENTSVLNPSVGFKIATSGDAIDVDVCQDEAGAFISSPIITTTAAVTRNRDALSYQVSGNISETAGTVLASWGVDSTNSTYQSGKCAIGLNGNGGRILAATSGEAATSSVFWDGTNTLTSTGGSSRAGLTQKHSTSWSGSSASTIGNGGSLAKGNYDGSLNAGSSLYIGVPTVETFGCTKDVYIWSTALTDSQLQQVTA